MPYQLTWENSNGLLFLRLIGQVSPEDFLNLNHDILAELATLERDFQVPLLIDTAETETIPQNFLDIKRTQRYLWENNLSWLIIVSEQKLLRLMLLLILNPCKPRIQFTETLDEALDFLGRV